MLFTLAICTWNRSAELKRVLDNLAICIKPQSSDWELIVVDNNSTDNTKKIVSQYTNILPIRYCLERTQGLSHARNKAIAESQGEWIIFTDDDVEIPLVWLVNYAQALESVSDYIAFAGGAVESKFLSAPPKAMIEAIPIVRDGFCGVALPKKLDISNPSDKIPFGANFALRKALISELTFDTDLGVNGDSRLMGEETAFMKGLLQQGKQGIWLQNIGLTHLVNSDRLTEEFIKRYLFGMGRSIVLWSPSPNEFKVPKWAYRAVVEDFITIIKCSFILRTDSVEKYTAIKRCYQLLGIINQVLRLKFSRSV
jgi:glycosyltransferase involved in cell wall biosynthesis